MADFSKYIPTIASKDSDWIIFHKKLDSVFSRKEANNWWMKVWQMDMGATNPATNTQPLRDYMGTKGIDIKPMDYGIIDQAKEMFADIIDVSKKVAVFVAILAIVYVGSVAYSNIIAAKNGKKN